MRIALPKGRLLDGVLKLLAAAGMVFRFRDDRDYRPTTTTPNVEAKLLKVRAIPQMVALGNFDVGFCGLDLIREAGYEQVEPILDLGLNCVTLVVAVPHDKRHLMDELPPRPLLIATEYENIADRWATDRNLAHVTIQTWGSTEAYAPDDADIVFDCIETGRTMAANNLVVIDRIMASSTHLVANYAALNSTETGPAITALRASLAEVCSAP